MTFLILAVLLIAATFVWFVLQSREKKRQAAGQSHHGNLRLFFAAFAAALMLFSGGCCTFLIYDLVSRPQFYNIFGWEQVAFLSVPPFLIGLLIWWLSLRRKDG